jgi:hypothetical protein
MAVGLGVECHDQAVANLSKIAIRLDAFMDLMGPVIGLMLLAVGIETYRNGGSMGWPIAGAVLLVINLWVAWRRLARRRKPAPCRSDATQPPASDIHG